MVRLEEKYVQAVNFRKRGFTYSEIAKIVGVSKSTVSNWLSKKAFSKKVRTENSARAARDNVKRIGLLNKARNAERKARYGEALRSAETEFKHYKNNPLFVAGLTTYMSVGDMDDHSRIRVTSNNQALHKIFISFLHEFLGVEKTEIKFWLLLPTDAKEIEEMKHWSKAIKLSVTQFGKTQLLGQSTKKGLHNGTGNTIIGNTVLKKKLIRWIELLAKEL